MKVTLFAGVVGVCFALGATASSAYRATVQHGKLCLVKKGFCLNFR